MHFASAILTPTCIPVPDAANWWDEAAKVGLWTKRRGLISEQFGQTIKAFWFGRGQPDLLFDCRKINFAMAMLRSVLD
jgi:hypothetical protein